MPAGVRDVEAFERGGKSALGSRLVAHHGECGAELGLRQRRREAVEARVGVVAQFADRRPAVAREHVERIGAVLAALLEVLRVGDEVLQPVERLAEALRVDGEALLLGARQEVGDVAREPEIAVAGAPDAEGAGAVLHLEHVVDGLLHALLELLVRRDAELAGHRVGIEERQRAAHRLLGAAVGIAVERGQQSGDVEGRGGADAQVDARAARDQVVHEVGGQRDAAAARLEGQRPSCA